MLSAAQGITAIDCTGPTFCVTIDGEGNSFSYDGSGWSGNLGAWGAANQISCVSPSFCVAAEGGPSVWDGSTWSQPSDVDTQGQLNAVSCASTTFCVIVDSNGRRPHLERAGLHRAGVHCHRATRLREQRLWAHVGVVPDRDLLPGRRLPGSGVRLERDDVERAAPSSTTGTR